MPTIQRLKLHDGQRAIVSHPARYKVARCGRRLGKTVLGSYWLTLRDEGSAIGGKRVAWFAPTYKLLMDVWTDMERVLRPVTRRANKTEQRIDLITGGIVDFWTLEDPDAGRGRRYHRVVIDEAAHARHLQEAWERAISPTLADYRGEAWFLSTPKGLNFFKTLYDRGLDPAHPDWASFHLPTTANPFISADEIESKRSEIPELVFRQEYLAEFVNFGAGLIKSEMMIDSPAPSGLPVVLGVDLAISAKQTSDFTAIVAMSRAPDTGVVYIREVERGRWSFHEAGNRIKAAAIRHRPVMIAVEQVQYQAAMVQELLRTTSLPVRGVTPDRDKVARFAPLLTRFEQLLVRLDPAGVPAYAREELLAFPEGDHDDCVDAMSCAWTALHSASSATRVATRGTTTFGVTNHDLSAA